MASKLREWRKARKLSTRAFADLVKTSDATISRIENYQQAPGFELLKRIHEATGGDVTPNDFMPPQERASDASVGAE